MPVAHSAAHSLTGLATWYSAAPGHAAAGPALRAWLGSDWRGSFVRVCHGEACRTVRLSDWCACGLRSGMPTVIDLARADFGALAAPSVGVIEVTVELGGPAPTLPATSTEDGP